MIVDEESVSDHAFSHYFNSYSTDFPHKKMMTIDLIENIRKD
jgi:hypothetical protein